MCGWRFKEYKDIEPRGLPKDVSYQVYCQYEKDRAGGGSWLTLAEIHQAHMEYMSHGHEPVHSMSILNAMLEELGKSYECRFVFWMNI